MPDLHAVGGRIKGSGFEVAVILSGEEYVEDDISPVIVERSWGRKVLDMASHLLWGA